MGVDFFARDSTFDNKILKLDRRGIFIFLHVLYNS